MGRIPKIESDILMDFYRRLVASGRGSMNRRRYDENWSLYFKTNGYNWISFTPEEAPCFNLEGDRITHTKNRIANFATEVDRDLCFLMLNGKIAFLFWAAIGDDFNVTGDVLQCVPRDWRTACGRRLPELLDVANDLRHACENAVQYKRNAGRDVGTYNLSKCRHVTDVSDQIFCECLGDSAVWHELELFYSQFVKTSELDS